MISKYLNSTWLWRNMKKCTFSGTARSQAGSHGHKGHGAGPHWSCVFLCKFNTFYAHASSCFSSRRHDKYLLIAHRDCFRHTCIRIMQDACMLAHCNLSTTQFQFLSDIQSVKISWSVKSSCSQPRRGRWAFWHYHFKSLDSIYQWLHEKVLMHLCLLERTIVGTSSFWRIPVTC